MNVKDLEIVCGILGIGLGFLFGPLGIIISAVVGILIFFFCCDGEENACFHAVVSSIAGGIFGWMVWLCICG